MVACLYTCSNQQDFTRRLLQEGTDCKHRDSGRSPSSHLRAVKQADGFAGFRIAHSSCRGWWAVAAPCLRVVQSRAYEFRYHARWPACSALRHQSQRAQPCVPGSESGRHRTQGRRWQWHPPVWLLCFFPIRLFARFCYQIMYLRYRFDLLQVNSLDNLRVQKRIIRITMFIAAIESTGVGCG